MKAGYDFLPMTALPSSAPRFPNIWFHVARDLIDELDVGIRLDGGRPRLRPFDRARWLVFRCLEQAVGVRADFGYFHNAEGCDAAARIANLDPYVDELDPRRSHGHQLHVRYYTHAFKRLDEGLIEIEDDAGLPRAYHRFAASVHYEIETGHPLHASVDWCPTCGRVGEYALEGDMCEVVHDPLGLEFLLDGTVRGRRIRDGVGLSYAGARGLATDYQMRVVEFAGAAVADANTARVALVFFDGFGERDG